MQLRVMNIPGMNVDGISPLADHERSEDGPMRAQQLVNAGVAKSSSGAGAAALAGASNTNGNANCNIAGVDLQHETSSSSSPSSMLGDPANTRIHPSSSGQRLHMLSPSSNNSFTNGVPSTDIAMEGDTRLDHESHLHRLTSPIIADLPLISMRSPPLSLDFAASENGNVNLQSPNGALGGGVNVTTAKYPSFTQVGLENNAVSSSSSTDSCSSLSPITSLSASSPASSISSTQQQSLFQQGLLLSADPTLLLHTTAVSPTASHLTEEEMDDSGPFICCWENCNQEFPQLESLVGHLDRDHTLAMDKYVCQWKDCARSRKPFDARYKLITHLRCHTGEKPYRCEYPTCTRSFSRLENLKLHVRTHTGEKPYECHYEGCTKKFNNTSDRAKHMKTHITRKPYVCKYPGCGKSYTDPSSMRKHIKYTHKLKERQEEASGHDGGLTSGQRHSRKRSASGSSTSPITPTTPGGPRFIQPHHPGIHGAVAVSLDGQLIQALPSPSVLTSTSGNLTGPPINGNAVATLTATPHVQSQQPQLIRVPLVQIPGAPSSVAQSLSLLAPSSSPLLSQGALSQQQQQHHQQQQQQVVMLLPTPAGVGVANASRSDIVALSSPHAQNTIAKLQQQHHHLPQKQSPLPPIQLLHQASTNNDVSESRVEQSQSAMTVAKNEEEQLRLQIAHLQQQLLQSQQAQLLAQQQVAQLQMKQQQVQSKSQVGSVMELNEKQERQAIAPMNSANLVNHVVAISSGGSPNEQKSTSKVTIVASNWPPTCADNSASVAAALAATTVAPPTIKSPQPSITSHLSSSSSLSSSPPPPVARKASGQIVLTSSMPAILSPTGHHPQTAVLPIPTQVPVMLGQAGPHQVIPIVQSQGVPQRQILYMTPSTS